MGESSELREEVEERELLRSELDSEEAEGRRRLSEGREELASAHLQLQRWEKEAEAAVDLLGVEVHETEAKNEADAEVPELKSMLSLPLGPRAADVPLPGMW